MNRPKIAWYGDDFTGATDTLLNAAAAGLRTLLFTRVPSVEQLGRAGTLDARIRPLRSRMRPRLAGSSSVRAKRTSPWRW